MYSCFKDRYAHKHESIAGYYLRDQASVVLCTHSDEELGHSAVTLFANTWWSNLLSFHWRKQVTVYRSVRVDWTAIDHSIMPEPEPINEVSWIVFCEQNYSQNDQYYSSRVQSYTKLMVRRILRLFIRPFCRILRRLAARRLLTRLVIQMVL